MPRICEALGRPLVEQRLDNAIALSLKLVLLDAGVAVDLNVNVHGAGLRCCASCALVWDVLSCIPTILNAPPLMVMPCIGLLSLLTRK